MAATCGALPTVTVLVTWVDPQPVTVYLIVAVPADTPVTSPLLFTVAILVALLLHTPPGVASANWVVPCEHTDWLPVIAATTGALPTVTVLVTWVDPQPVTVYMIVAVPADTPVTSPLLFTVAILVALLLHTPPAVASAN